MSNFFNIRYISLLLITAFVISCDKSSDEPEPTNTVKTKDLTIDPATTYQTIAGFGGANQMWGTQFPSASDIKSAFGEEDTDLGLSIFRIRVASNPDEWPLIVDVAKEAQNYGAKILASPWSPPANLKSNGSDIGGHLLEENYGAYAEHLNAFVDYMASNGVNIYAISIQNEPDIQVSYESCDWTVYDMINFLENFGHLIEGTKVAAPESFNFNQTYTNALLADAEAVSNLDIVAGHIYGGGLAPFTLAEQKGKEIWMTEYLMNQGATSQWSELSANVIWDESLAMLETIHESMMHNWNAYIWWYIKRYYSFIGDGTQGTTSGAILKRGYAFSHFSKFVRPGYVRVDAELASGTDALVSAYQGEGKTVIVLVNPSSSPVANVSFSIAGSVPSSATAYTTTLAANREVSQLEPQDGKLLMNLLAKSVTTVVIEN